jgi:hypothetical protein
MSKKTKIETLRPKTGKNQPQQLAQEDYQVITERILKISRKRKSILFAGTGSGTLPITIPVNVAIQLAEKGKHCLLIDLDLRRDGLARVFEISNEQINQSLMPKAIKTHFPNLLIWPGRHFIRTRLMNIVEVVDAACKSMDIILINAPSFLTSLDRGQILAAGQACCIFSGNNTEAEEMLRLVKDSQCALIGNIRIALSSEHYSDNSNIPVDFPKTTA